ncbi:hypothetical protein F2Q68_00007484 [Brassica cretica]|uniref:Uncharacterized protein n=1 Tax=Brassica cretica TaxID=69181 RepID=A0A8S9KVE8_BRACR|nr:hypothetical protein F2Q68_00007484 [Brassica cretica]
MEITERRDDEIRDAKESANIDTIKSQYVTDSFSDERYSRELKDGLHPLRVSPLFLIFHLIFNFESDLSGNFTPCARLRY